MDENNSVRHDLIVLVTGLSQDALYKIYEGSLLNNNPTNLTTAEHTYILNHLDDKDLIDLLEGEMDDAPERSPDRVFVQAIIDRLKKKCGI